MFDDVLQGIQKTDFSQYIGLKGLINETFDIVVLKIVRAIGTHEFKIWSDGFEAENKVYN